MVLGASSALGAKVLVGVPAPAGAALHIAKGLPCRVSRWPFTMSTHRVLVVTHHLMGTAEVATLLGVSRTRVGQLAQRDDFPAPVARLAAGPVWESADIERWARATGRIT